jgi:hypothetical protein
VPPLQFPPPAFAKQRAIEILSPLIAKYINTIFVYFVSFWACLQKVKIEGKNFIPLSDKLWQKNEKARPEYL